MFDLSLLSRKARPLVGLDVSSSSVKLLELAGGEGEALRVERYVIEPMAREAVVDGNIANMDLAVDAVRRALRRFGAGVKGVAMALPASAVITKRIMLPGGLREEEMEVQVESEANQYIPFALDEVNLDFQVLGEAVGEDQDVEVLIAASRKEKVEDRIALAEAAGLKAEVMDVESFATQSAFDLVVHQIPQGGKDRIIALVDVGATMTRVTVFLNGNEVYTREQVFGGNQLTLDIARLYGMSVEEAEAAKRNNSLPDNFGTELQRPFADSLALEISRVLQFFFTSTQYNQVDQIVMAGGCAVIPGLADVVKSRTQIETLVANPFGGMAVSSKVRPKALVADAPALMVACGLAMRRVEA
ncbi:MAG: pilus assembly protein PilM [Zoogloeaceae bacterium]|nr:pilus assembly protein PilM [Zoogloeaceae bacterium]